MQLDKGINNSSPILGEVAESQRGYDYQCNNHPSKLELRKELRKNATPAEARLWSMLKGKQHNGVRWRRQFSIGPYVVDFYSPSQRLAIELDGRPHYTESGADIDFIRTKYLNFQGVRVIRFENSEVWKNLEGVLQRIEESLIDPSACGTSPKTGEEF